MGVHHGSHGSHGLALKPLSPIRVIRVIRGHSPGSVAVVLSVKTADAHRANLMRKLDLHSVSEVVLYAVRNQIVQA